MGQPPPLPPLPRSILTPPPQLPPSPAYDCEEDSDCLSGNCHELVCRRAVSPSPGSTSAPTAAPDEGAEDGESAPADQDAEDGESADGGADGSSVAGPTYAPTASPDDYEGPTYAPTSSPKDSYSYSYSPVPSPSPSAYSYAFDTDSASSNPSNSDSSSPEAGGSLSYSYSYDYEPSTPSPTSPSTPPPTSFPTTSPTLSPTQSSAPTLTLPMFVTVLTLPGSVRLSNIPAAKFNEDEAAKAAFARAVASSSSYLDWKDVTNITATDASSGRRRLSSGADVAFLISVIVEAVTNSSAPAANVPVSTAALAASIATSVTATVQSGSLTEALVASSVSSLSSVAVDIDSFAPLSPTSFSVAESISPNHTPFPTPSPTLSPTPSPTLNPTVSPTLSPTFAPTLSPTPFPSFSPTTLPPTRSPTVSPTRSPKPDAAIPKATVIEVLIGGAALAIVGFFYNIAAARREAKKRGEAWNLRDKMGGGATVGAAIHPAGEDAGGGGKGKSVVLQVQSQ